MNEKRTAPTLEAIASRLDEVATRCEACVQIVTASSSRVLEVHQSVVMPARRRALLTLAGAALGGGAMMTVGWAILAIALAFAR